MEKIDAGMRCPWLFEQIVNIKKPSKILDSGFLSLKSNMPIVILSGEEIDGFLLFRGSAFLCRVNL